MSTLTLTQNTSAQDSSITFLKLKANKDIESGSLRAGFLQRQSFFVECLLLIVWYLSSILGNNISRSLLKNSLVSSINLISVQFLTCFLVSLALACVGIFKPEKFTFYVAALVVPVSIAQMSSQLLTSFAVSVVTVSSLHQLKGIAPLFTVAFCNFFFNSKYNSKVYLSLVPVCLGVLLTYSSTRENASTLAATVCALGSTALLVLQNIWSKQCFSRRKCSRYTSILYTSGISLVFSLLLKSILPDTGATIDAHSLFLLFLNSVFYSVQLFASLCILDRVSPVTHSVYAVGKRCFVIASSLFLLEKEFSLLKVAGLAVTVSGMVAYQLAKTER